MGFLDTSARNPDITIVGITLALQFGNALFFICNFDSKLIKPIHLPTKVWWFCWLNNHKTMSIKVIRYRLPSYWACPLINDDYTGLTDEECEEIQRFLEAAEGYPVDVDLETQGFYRCNDAGTLPGECADFIFHKCND